MRLLSLVVGGGLCLAMVARLGAAEPAMAFVSMERLFDEYYKTKAANIQLKSRFDALETPRRELLEQAGNLKAEVEKLSAEARDKSLSDDGRNKKRSEVEDKFALYREAERKLAEFDTSCKKQFGEQMKQSQQQLVGEIRAVIQAYVKKHGIRIVFDNSGKTLNSVESVVYHDAALDITEPILAILNKNAVESDAGPQTQTNTTKKTP